MTGLAGAVMVLANLANAKVGITLLMTTLKTMPIVGAIVNGGFNLMALGAKTLGVAIMNIPIIGWIAAVIVGLIAIGTYFYNTSASFRGVLWGLWNSIKTVFSGIGEFVVKVSSGIFDVLKGVFNPANWFNKDYHFADGLKKITDAATEYGKKIGESFSQGKEAGMEDYYKAHPEERPKPDGRTGATKSATNLNKTVTPVITPTNLGGGGSKGSGGLSGSGSGVGGVKNITQKIDIKNYFTVSEGSNVEVIAERVVRVINDRLRDATVALQ